MDGKIKYVRMFKEAFNSFRRSGNGYVSSYWQSNITGISKIRTDLIAELSKRVNEQNDIKTVVKQYIEERGEQAIKDELELNHCADIYSYLEKGVESAIKRKENPLEGMF